MEHPTCGITNPEVELYAEEHSSAEDEVLYRINRSIHLHTSNPRMSSGPYQGQLLQMLSKMIRPKLAVEVGVFAGYASICIARGLCEGGVLHAIEAEEEFETMIRAHLQEAGVADRVRLHIGKGLDVIPTLPDGIDLAYIDADKINYGGYYEMMVSKMSKGGVMLIDNVLWNGKVLFEQPKGDHETAVLKELNERIEGDERVENVLLPIRDGLMMVRVK